MPRPMLGRRRDDTVRQHGASSLARRRAPEHARGDQPTFGLITALPVEYTAMSGLLEDPVDRYVSPDPAQYTLGGLPSVPGQPNHTVALTLLGSTATNAAADGCANMIRSYPSIKVVIMVGIAAGIPQVSRPDQHVRLGDVVVAEGLVEYRTVQGVPS